MRKYNRLCVCLLFFLIGGIFLGSYAKKEVTKTIVLEENDKKAAENEYVVKNIKEYFYEGTQKEEGWIAEEQNSEYIYALKYTTDGYEYQKIDIGQGKIFSKLLLETKPLRKAKIAPGGKYIAYEREYAFGVELLLFSVEGEARVLIGESNEFSFAWSGDGKKLFFTFIDEDETNTESDAQWALYCVDTENFMKPEVVACAQGNAGIHKNIVPNTDGSKVYVGYEDGEAVTNKRHWLFLVEYFMTGNVAYDNSSVISESMLKLPEDITYPIRYTKAGLFARGEGEKIFLITNLEKEPQIKLVAEMDSEEFFICENGDHLFVLKQEGDTKRFEFRILHLEEGEVVTNQLLYKDVSQNWAGAVVSMDDRKIILKSCEYLGEKKYSYKITLLEYGDR